MDVTPSSACSPAGWHEVARVDELTEARLSRPKRLFGSEWLRLHAIVNESMPRPRIAGRGDVASARPFAHHRTPRQCDGAGGTPRPTGSGNS